MSAPRSNDSLASDAPPKFQFSLAKLLAWVTAICVVGAVATQSGELVFVTVPFTIGICMLICSAAFKARGLRCWGVVACVSAVPMYCLIPVCAIPLEVARRSQCASNLQQLGIALHNYHDVHKRLPSRFSVLADKTPALSWRVLLLPYVDSNSLYKQFHLDEPWDSQHNLPLATHRPELYACPSAKKRLKSESDYFAIGGADGCFPDDQAVRFPQVTDGLSNTLLVVESHTLNVVWSEPRDLNPATMSWQLNQGTGVSSGHNGGACMALADGSTRFLSNNVDPEVIKQLANRHDGKPAEGSDY